MLRHLDLFSGIGGFALAAEAAGWETIGFSEIEPYACRVLERHWPGVPNYGDVRNIPGDVSAELVTGGFPCQPFSVAGKRRGAADDRHLWPEMLAVIARIRPAWVCGENVPGLVRLGLDRVLSDLESEGYTTRAFDIPACGIGAWHRRHRIWIVAYAGRLREPQSARVQRDKRRRPGDAGADVPDTRCGRREGLRSNVGRMPIPSWWDVEPAVGRVAHGIPRRVDRLRGLGNAIVPQVAEPLLRWMREAMEQ